MKAVILHLSDIHLRAENNPITSQYESIAKATFSHLPCCSKLIIIVSGDIAFSGKEDEYEVAYEFLDNIKEIILSEKTIEIEFVLCPGNHDCNFDESDSTREFILKSLNGENLDCIDSGIINSCTKHQSEYFKFRELFESDYLESDELWTTRKITVGDKEIIFDCINLAWASSKSEQQGKMIFPFEKYKNKKDFSSDLRISVLHHPLNWLEQRSYRDFKTHLRAISDFVFTGHEHLNNAGTYDDIESGRTVIIEAGVLQEKTISNSSFGVISINFDSKENIISQYFWNEDVKCFEPKESRSIQGFEIKDKNCLGFSDTFSKVINDCGAYFKHSEKRNLTLSDFFTYPTLKIKSQSEENDADISSRSLIVSSNIEKGVILSGDDTCGKTSLIYSLINEYSSTGFIPLFIKGDRIKSSKASSLDLLIERILKEQYSEEDIINKFNQSFKSKKIIFIDDFNEMKIKSELAKNDVVKYLVERFEKIIISVDSAFEVNELVASEVKPVILSFDHYDIQPFGYMKRTEIIRKWYEIGELDGIPESEFIGKCDKAEKLMDTVMDKSLIPASPIYLLTLLQSVENDQGNDLADSSLGHYYSYLLNQAYLDVGIKKDKLAEELQYAIHLAWYFHTKGCNYITEREFKEYNRQFSDRWHSVSFDKKKETLLDAKILEYNGEEYSFHYMYNYYFLKGKYLSDFILDENVIKEIKHSVKHLYMKKHAHSILFLAHHSSSDNVLLYIKEAVESIFSNRDAVDFNGGSQGIIDLIQHAPDLSAPKNKVVENRNKHNEQRDKAEASKDKMEIITEQDPNNLTLIAKLSMLFKTTDILGQILKAQYSKIERPKKAELIKTLFLAPLRALQDFYLLMEQNPTSLIDAIENALAKKSSNISEENRKKLARLVVSRAIQGVSGSFIIRAAQAVNSESLKEDIEDVVQNNSSLAFELIEIAIGLDSHKPLERGKLKSIYESSKSNLVARKVLDLLIFNRLYMFKTSEKDMQWLSSELEYDLKNQHTIAYQNKQGRIKKQH